MEPSKGASDPGRVFDNKNSNSDFQRSSEKQELAGSGSGEGRGISKAQRKLAKEQTKGPISQSLDWV